MADDSDRRDVSTRSSAAAILVLDGAMGTMVQRHGLTEADFRGAALRAPIRATSRATTTSSC